MPTPRLKSLTLRLLSVLSLLMVSPSLWAVSTTIVISQVYGGGGSTSAQYNADYIELFNLSSSPQSLNGLAVQYISAAGTTAASTIALPNVTLAPGQRFLVSATTSCTPATTPTCTNIPTPDLTSTTLAASGTAGRIYLTSTTTALTVTAGTCAATNVIDTVAYGSTATCAEGGAPAPATTTTVIAVRTNACVDTDNNAADFTAVTVLSQTNPPRNSSSTPTPCSSGTSTGITVVGAASPTSVYQGSSTLLTAVLTAGTNPASTGIAVTANLTAFGGSSTQPLYDDGTHGDTTANDGTYSYSLAVGSSATLGSNTIAVAAMDSQARSATGTIALTVLAPVTLVPIHTVQGSTPGTAAYNGQTVMIAGIVTGVKANGFYLQSRDVDADTDPATPEGIFVHTSTGAVPSTATIGTYLQVTGVVSLYPTAGPLPGTELDSPTAYTVLATSQSLPAAITLTTTNPSPTGGFAQLQRYQSMRVAVPSLTTTAPTDGTQPSEAAELYVSNGQFYGTVTGNARPEREPGLEILDPLTASQPTTIARFDDNPEVFQVDSVGMTGGTAGPLDVTSNTILTSLSGVLDFTSGEPVFTIDATTRPTVTGGMAVKAVRAALPGETTIGDQNMERFYDVAKETSGAVALTPAGYALRLAKASLVVRNVYSSPDIFCLEEMENIQTLNDLIAKISADAVAAGQTDPQYTGYLVNGNDTSGINVAFMVKQSKITVIDVTQFGKTTTTTGTTTILNDRPPLVLHAGIKRIAQADYPITVIVNHLRSLNGVTGNTSTGANVRTKREQQAEFLANLIQGYQSSGEHVISVGDYNAFEFNDGLVDSLGIIRGSAAPANQDVLAGTTGLVSPVLVDAAPTNLATGAYSYVYQGNAQSIDHVLVTQDIASLITTDAAHFDADFPVIDRNDPTTPLVSSDHDGLVAYLKVPGTTAISLTPASLTFASQPVKSTTSQTVTVMNTGTGAIAITSITATANFAQTNNCGTSLAAGASCKVTVSFTPTVTGTATGTVTLTDNDVTGTQTVSLSGTGAGLFSSVALSPSTATVVAGASYTLTATITSNAGTSPTGTVTFTDGTTSLGSKPVANGAATLTTTTLSAGSHTITAVYSGDASYPMSPVSASASVTITPAISVSPAALTFSSQLVKSTTSQTVTVQNSGPQAIPITSIVVSASFTQTNTCGSSLAANTSCVVTVSFTPATTGTITGTLTLTDSDGTGMQTVSLTGTGAPISSNVSLTPLVTTVVAGATYSVTATVTSNVGTSPTGTVTFNDGTTSLGSKAVANGTAMLTTTTLGVGTHTITAVYSGDANYPMSGVSAAASVIVTAVPVPDFTFSGSNPQVIVTQSQPSSSTILNVAMTNGFSSAVTFTCSGLPANSRCTFSPASLSASGSTTLTVTINSASAGLRFPLDSRLSGVMAATLLALPFCFRKRVRSALRIAAVLLVMAGVAGAVSGCSTASVTPAGSSSMVTVTATGGGLTRTTSFTLLVQ